MVFARSRVSELSVLDRLKRFCVAFCAVLGVTSGASIVSAGGFECPKSHSYLLMNGGLFKPGQGGALAKPLRILAIGSSSTEGVGSTSPKFTYPQQLKDDLARTWGIAADVTNAGIGGETVDETIVRLRRQLKNERPNLVIWQVGTNDAVSGADEGRFRALLQNGIDAAAQAKAALILLDPQYLPGVKNGARYQKFIDDIASSGVKQKVPVFSRYAMMKAWAAGTSADVLSSMLAKDHFHMSDRGYACLAQRLAGDLASQWGNPVRLIGADQPAPVVPVGLKGPSQAIVIVPRG